MAPQPHTACRAALHVVLVEFHCWCWVEPCPGGRWRAWLGAEERRSAGPRADPSSTRRFFFRVRISTAAGANAGATRHSTKRLDTASAVASSTGTVKAITEPKADTGSQASAFR